MLDRTGDRLDARAAAKRAVTLEPDNWRHHFRLSYVSWGEERLRAAHRTLALLPDFPLAHWLAATVHVARQVAGRGRARAARPVSRRRPASRREASRFSAVALHWLLGLIYLARGDEARALEEFERELSFESAGQLYARECAANTWYAIGALRLRQGRPADARAAFARAIERVAGAPDGAAGTHRRRRRRARIAPPVDGGSGPTGRRTSPVDAAVFQAARLVVAGAHSEAARILDDALAGAPAAAPAWLLPIEPMLHVTARPDVWARTLAHLRNRAS